MANRALIKAMLILPGTALVLIPGLLLALTRQVRPGWGLAWPANVLPWALGGLLLVCGMMLARATVRSFVTIGRGTPAPWDPPVRLVVVGPYRHCRNPMITGAAMVLLGEAALLGSWWILGWAALFAVGNHFWFMFHEEPGLLKRFGEDYAEYRRNVPRWLPRRRPWDGLDVDR